MSCSTRRQRYRLTRRVTALLYLALVAYGLVDALQTEMLLTLGARELNPLYVWLFELTGTAAVMYPYKMLWLALLGAALVTYLKKIY